ncbi:MAG: YbhB/YbcL family Raf kinase inhibitor-like protein [Kofleriaceae bacterium]|nr:YbhB/YbcL family Raf kinase inhibitor-like protein [Kofleriaceae bacterium]
MTQRISKALLIVLLPLLGCASGPKASPKVASTPAPIASESPEMSEEAKLPLQGPEPTKGHPALQVTSTDFKSDGTIGQPFAFNQFGCTGDNQRPQLSWATIPEGTKSFAVIVHDPDAPTGVGFFHWVAINIPANVTSLGETLPASAAELHTDYGRIGYGGPCPPEGRTHRYVFSVYALDVPKLELPPGATGALTRFALAAHTLAVGRLVGRYGR